jgi:hypothetical protein
MISFKRIMIFKRNKESLKTGAVKMLRPSMFLRGAG